MLRTHQILHIQRKPHRLIPLDRFDLWRQIRSPLQALLVYGPPRFGLFLLDQNALFFHHLVRRTTGGPCYIKHILVRMFLILLQLLTVAARQCTDPTEPRTPVSGVLGLLRRASSWLVL